MIRRRCSFKKYAWNVVSGKSPLIINNSERDSFRSFSVIGKSEQVTTMGKNLLDEGKIKNLSNYIKVNITYYVYRLTGLSVGENYTISRSNAKSGTNMLFGISVNQGSYDNAKFMIYDGLNETFNKKCITWTQETGDYVDILFSYKSSSNQTTQEKLTELFQRILYVQLEKGSVSTAYEPYTGGKPSPSPEYPQEIKSVGKWNEAKQKYEVDVKVTGKNLFDVEFLRKTQKSWGKVSYYYIPLFVGKGNRISVSLEKDLSLGLPFFVLIGKEKGSDINGYYWLYHSTINHLINKKISFTAEHDVIYLNWSVGLDKKDRDSLFENIFDSLQIEISDAPTEYQPYTEQTLTLTSDRPITKWDKLVEQDGQIGWMYGSKRYIVTGNEVFESREGYNIESYTNRFFVLNDLLMDNDVPKPLAYVKCLRRKQYVYAPNIFEEGFETNKNQFHIKFLNERVGISTSDDHAVRTLKYSEYIKNIYKSGEPIEILYATKNKEFVPLPQSEQDSIRSFISYSPTTIITVDGGEVDPIVEVLCAIKEMM